MKLYIYKVHKIEDFKNEAATLDHDYMADFEEYREIRGYVKIDYYVTDTENLEYGKVYCCGDFLIKVVEKIYTFENDPIGIMFDLR